MKYRCAVIGQPPMRFPWGFDEEDSRCCRMKLEMAQHILELCQCGVTEFQVACDPGVGLYAAEVVNALRENGSTIRLVCVLPHEEQAPSGRRSSGSGISICSPPARNWIASTAMNSLTHSFWPISGSSSNQPWCWPSMIPTLRMGAPRTEPWPMPLYWAGQSC